MPRRLLVPFVIALVVCTAAGVGRAAPARDVRIAPAHASFGAVPLGGTTYRSVTLTNTSAVDVAIEGGWSSTARLNPGFVFPTGDGCLVQEWQTLLSGATCTIRFGFAPQAAGRAEATFLLFVDDFSNIVEIRLAGSGVAR